MTSVICFCDLARQTPETYINFVHPQQGTLTKPTLIILCIILFIRC